MAHSYWLSLPRVALGKKRHVAVAVPVYCPLATLFCRVLLFGSRQTLCRVPVSWLPTIFCLLEGCKPGGCCRVQHSAKALPADFGPLPSFRGTRRSPEFQ